MNEKHGAISETPLPHSVGGCVGGEKNNLPEHAIHLETSRWLHSIQLVHSGMAWRNGMQPKDGTQVMFMLMLMFMLYIRHQFITRNAPCD
ncbi:hypothetical protein K504DRAFT_97805 [Pleomassaria siparia CBS 279.74]|uniref:Uncharacterized protein n=1 Tax=Pleomassaria siparia CBS 279.74 TaxID=1314801 RepID=A0A6G1JX90_9PLEO|nr:hypothetical protein K504DRAFT_97805 [Pleomassaria siparia CBS 279.74]